MVKEGFDFSWREDRIFTGLSSGYPVELFIELIEREAHHWNHNEAKMCNDALRLIASDNTPAGLWKKSMDTRLTSISWDDLKTELMEAFSNREAYSLDQSLQQVLSLTKADAELFTTFLFRVEWVLEAVLGLTGNQLLTKIFFLLGISQVNQVFVLDKLKNGMEMKEDCLEEVVSLLDDSRTLVPKQEPMDEGLQFSLTYEKR